MFTIYKGAKKIGQTADTSFLVDGLSPDTEYTLGVSRTVDGVESAVTKVSSDTIEPLARSAVDVATYHVGGGYYDIDGERVRGKEAAQNLLESKGLGQ